jgi:hypothetical protein
MEQRILPPELEDPPKLSERAQRIVAIVFVVLTLAVALIVARYER